MFRVAFFNCAERVDVPMPESWQPVCFGNHHIAGSREGQPVGKSIDRNLLFGMMAVELQVIERQQLLEHLAEAETEDIANYLQRKDLLPP